MLVGKTCGNCAAYSALTNECRRKAPSIMMIQKPNGEPATVGVFPATAKDRWCCEWLADEPGALQ